MLKKQYDSLRGASSVFFIGIGGISMSSLAQICRKAGYRVAGSDRSESALTKRLTADGIPVFIGHDASHIDGFDAVVYTAAVGKDNPELAEAGRRGLPAVYRAVLLGDIMKTFPCRIGISGMHGKSGTTGMVAHMLSLAQRDPTVVSGAEMREYGGAYHIGREDCFVFEACEYKESFLDFYPSIAVILNLDLDHTDYYADMTAIRSAFRRYAAIASENGGITVVNGDDENAMLATGSLARLTFGENAGCDYRIRNAGMSKGYGRFSLWKGEEELVSLSLPVPGRHMIYNAAAAAVCGDLAGLSKSEIKNGIESFCGIARRFEKVGNVNGADVILDYAHHPTELEAVLQAARGITKGRVLCCFEPHTYTRTKTLYADFIKALSLADKSVILPVYAARETDTLGLNMAVMAKAIPGGLYAPNYQKCSEILSKEAMPGDIILILGAGTVDQVAHLLSESGTK